METIMTIIDHLYFLIIVFVQPVVGYITFNKLVRRAEAGEDINVNHIYNSTMAGHWALFVVLLGFWALANRQWADLGFGLPVDYRLYVGIALTLVAIVFMALQLRQLGSADSKTAEGLRCQLGKLEFIFPRNNNQLTRFYTLSVTAGIVEEAIWRGFMFWYLGHVMPLWAAALVSSVGFGLAHVYQGAANVPKVILIGTVFAGLYLLTGSIWLPMVLHAVFDIVQGRAVYGILTRPAPNPVDTSEQPTAT